MAKDFKIGGVYVESSFRTSKFEKQLKTFQGKVNKMSRDLERSGRRLTQNVTLPLAAIGGAAIFAARDFDNATAKIRRGTGATGKQLQGLQEDFNKVFAKVPESAGQVSTAIADLNTRLGLSGEPLQELSQRMLQLSRIAEEDVGLTIRNSTRLFGDWSVETKEAASTLDFLFKASQATGAKVNDLSNNVVKYGATLRQLGFDLEESITLFGRFEKEGVNTERIFSGLQQGLAKLSDAGFDDLRVGLEGVFSEIKNAATEAEANSIAFRVFGREAGADLAAAVREGRFELEALIDQFERSPETIARAAEQSKTFDEQLRKLGNAGKILLNELGTPLIETITPAIQFAAQKAQDFGKALGGADPRIKKFVIGMGILAASFGPVKLAIAKIVSLFLLGGPWGVALAAGVAIAYAFKDDVVRIFDETIQDARKIFVVGVTKLADALDAVGMDDAAFGYRQLAKSVLKTHQANEKTGRSAEKLKLSYKGAKADTEKIEKAFKSASGGIDQATGAIDKLLGRLGGVGGAGGSAERGSKGITESIEKGVKDAAPEVSKTLSEAHEDSVDFWRNSFENAISGVKFSLSDALQQVAVGFAAKIASSLVGSLEGVSSPQGLGDLLAEKVLGSTTGGGGLENLLGGGGSGGGFDIGSLFGGLKGRAPGVQGPPMQDGSFSSSIFGQGTVASSLGGAAGISVAATQSIASLQKLGDSSQETAEGLSQLAGTGIGAFFGGPIGAGIGSAAGSAVGKLVGGLFGGSTNPETLERERIVGKLNELIDKVGGASFFDSKSGSFRGVGDIDVGSPDRFNKDVISPLLSQFGTETTNVFEGVGQSLAGQLGAKFEKTGGQLGVILQEQVGGSFQALKSIIQATGLTFENFTETLIQRGKKGAESWLEVVSKIRDGAALFQDGLRDVGNTADAVTGIFASGGRGQKALNFTKALFIEARERGITEISELLSFLESSGQATAQQVKVLADAFADANVNSIDEIADATDDLRVAEVVAAIDASLQDLGGQWTAQTEQVKSYAAELDKLQGREVNVTVNTRFRSDGDAPEGSGLTTFARGGVVTRPTGFRFRGGRGLMGEAGPEAILPLTRVGGKLGVSAGGGGGGRQVVINVDASGAAPGVEASIIDAMAAMREDILGTVEATIQNAGAY